MKIIEAVEASRRDPYCGMIGWIGFDGAMDSSIVIRTLTITPDGLIAQAGGGNDVCALRNQQIAAGHRIIDVLQ